MVASPHFIVCVFTSCRPVSCLSVSPSVGMSINWSFSHMSVTCSHLYTLWTINVFHSLVVPSLYISCLSVDYMSVICQSDSCGNSFTHVLERVQHVQAPGPGCCAVAVPYPPPHSSVTTDSWIRRLSPLVLGVMFSCARFRATAKEIIPLPSLILEAITSKVSGEMMPSKVDAVSGQLPRACPWNVYLSNFIERDTNCPLLLIPSLGRSSLCF